MARRISRPGRERMTDAAGAPFRLDGKVALVTGAGSGIGEQIARLFARQGAGVVIGDVDEAGGTHVAEAIVQAGLRARYQHLDVSDASSVVAAVRTAVEGFGGLHILVNNAGIGYVGDALETDEREYEKLMAVNVKGVFLCSQVALANMVEHGGGAIVNMASVAGQVGVSRRFAYGASKGAVIAM